MQGLNNTCEYHIKPPPPATTVTVAGGGCFAGKRNIGNITKLHEITMFYVLYLSKPDQTATIHHIFDHHHLLPWQGWSVVADLAGNLAGKYKPTINDNML